MLELKEMAEWVMVECRKDLTGGVNIAAAKLTWVRVRKVAPCNRSDKMSIS
jgi:hypothetical protein